MRLHATGMKLASVVLSGAGRSVGGTGDGAIGDAGWAGRVCVLSCELVNR
jgi:hypothetical protein